MIAGHLNLSELELTMYLDNPVVHHETFALVMSIRRNKMIICETIKMMEDLQEAVDEMAYLKREEFIESEQEEETYVLAGHEFTRKEFMCYLETTMAMQQISDLRLVGSIKHANKKLNKG